MTGTLAALLSVPGTLTSPSAWSRSQNMLGGLSPLSPPPRDYSLTTDSRSNVPIGGDLEEETEADLKLLSSHGPDSLSRCSVQTTIPPESYSSRLKLEVTISRLRPFCEQVQGPCAPPFSISGQLSQQENLSAAIFESII